jgi:outer membrane receptor protein involved in Fe transport
MMKTLKFSSIMFLSMMILLDVLFAGNTGKKSGIVTDKQTGEPVAGANVLLQGTSLGAATDAEGYFYIIGVPPGKHDIQCVYVGYHTITISQVFVQTDLTTRINIKLESELIESPTITVTADREIIQHDLTSTRRVTTAEDIDYKPGMESVSDVLRIMPGVTFDKLPERLELQGGGSALQIRDESLSNIHVRGGRGGEILFMVDGMPISHPLYGGRAVLNLNVEDVEQIELLTGGFSAEYGQAQSGVVNITSKSGSDKFEVGLEYKRDLVAGVLHSQSRDYASFSAGGPLFLPRGFGNLSYFVSGNVSMAIGAADNQRTRDKYKIFNLVELTEKQNNNSSINVKFNWNLSPKDRFVVSGNGTWLTYTNYYWIFKYYPDNTAQYYRDTYNINFRYNHIVSRNTYYNINLGYLDVKYNASLDGKRSPADFWFITKDQQGQDSIYTVAQPPQVDPSTYFYNDQGFETIWKDDKTKTFTFKSEWVSQIHNAHLLKSGVSVQYHDLIYADMQDAAYKLSNYGEWKYRGGDYYDPPPGPFPEFGQNRWYFHTYPLMGDFYLQDKFELESLILNIGARFDWLFLGEQLNDEAYKEKWEAATGLESNWNLFKYAVSPRFGISFPVSEFTVLYFSYGHFNQLPEMPFFYRDPWSGGFTGNPHLNYEKTILYEFGFTHQFSESWSIDIKNYGKDISDQAGTELLRAALGLPVQLHVNNGYGRARGMEVELNKQYSHFTAMSLGYTLQWASGYASSAYSDYVRTAYDLPKPIRERPLDWDIRHQVIMNLSLISPPKQPIKLFGMYLPDNWNITLLGRFTTGRPYTPGTTDPLETRVRENGENMPTTWEADLRMNKTFDTKFVSISLFLDIYNIFNNRNVVEVNVWTGEPYKYGDVDRPTTQIFSWKRMYSIMSPYWWTSPRSAQIGLRLNF